MKEFIRSVGYYFIVAICLVIIFFKAIESLYKSIKMKFLRRLNYEGFGLMFIITGLGAMSRSQDSTLIQSLQVWAIIGVPISFIFLFIGMKYK